MLVILLRTLIIYILVIVVLRLMGKRQIGQLQPSELVVAMMLSDLACIPMESAEMPLVLGIIPILTLFIAETCFSFFTLKSRKIRKLLSGSPAILIEKGQVSESEMRRLRFNIDDLMEELRTAGYVSIADIEYAIIESNGGLSVIPKSNKRPLTAADFDMSLPYETIPFLLVTDGSVNEHALEKSGHDIAWLLQKLNEFDIHTIEDVFIATMDISGEFFVQKKRKKEEMK